MFLLPTLTFYIHSKEDSFKTSVCISVFHGFKNIFIYNNQCTPLRGIDKPTKIDLLLTVMAGVLYFIVKECCTSIVVHKFKSC